MGNSLRDQLLKAGLVDPKRARQAELDDRQRSKQASKNRKSGLAAEPTAAQIAAEEARLHREREAERSRELNRAREEERARKALRAEMKQWLQTSAVPHGKGDTPYRFTHGTKVKKLHVEPAHHARLARGELAVVAWEGAYYLVPAEVADQVRQRLPETFVFVAQAEAVDPDDPYAAFPIPDDLVW
ncbi:MAG: DUF2058 domain-containing protein [Deferrisomatales bacterium]